MARLQILELPTTERPDGTDETPYILVIDQVGEETATDITRWPDDIATRTGARHVLCFSETVDIPTNETPVDPDGYPLKFRIEPDFETFREQVQDEIRKTQGELRRAINRDAVAERTSIARDVDRLAEWKNGLLDALGMDRTRDWDDIRNAAAGLRKQRDAQSEAIERVRNLHRPVEHRGRTICWECSAYDFPGQSTDNAPVAHDQCGTLRALNGEPVVRQTPNGPTTGKVVGGSGLADA